MPNCAVLICKNASRSVNYKLHGITYHIFPKDPDLKNKWILATGRKNWFPSNNSTICSAHFHSTDYTDTKKSRRLSQFAYPSIDVWRATKNNESSDETTNGCPKNKTDDDDSDAPSSPNTEDYDEPAPSATNKRLLKQRERLQAALRLERMKVKRFREQNRRKDKKIETLHNIIFELKKKMIKKSEEAEGGTNFI